MHVGCAQFLRGIIRGMEDMLRWNVYEIAAQESSLNGVMLRGRIRKFGIENSINVLAENTEDVDNGVRFATLDADNAERVSEYVQSIIGDATVSLVFEGIANPVLSKNKVNDEDRYTL